jgi:transmembrane sensor
MSRVLRFPDPLQAEERAALWITRLDRGLRGGEREQLRRWLATDKRHRAALMGAARLWDRMDVLADMAELFPLHEGALGGRMRRAGALAATLVAVAGVVAALLVFRAHEDRGAMGTGASAVAPAELASHGTPVPAFLADYATAVGEQRSIDLPDHSVIRLNTNTALRVEFTGTARLIRMARGEANFEVAKDRARVFTVRVAGLDFNAVGTAFDIRADSARGVRLTVTEGRVRVRPASQPAAGASVDEQRKVASGAADLDVDANRQAVIGQSGESVQDLAPAEIAAVTAWQHGMMVFDATPLEQVVSEVSRYSTRRVVIAQRTLAQIPVSGYFKVGDIDALSAALERNFGIDVQKSDDVITLSARPSK